MSRYDPMDYLKISSIQTLIHIATPDIKIENHIQTSISKRDSPWNLKVSVKHPRHTEVHGPR